MPDSASSCQRRVRGVSAVGLCVAALLAAPAGAGEPTASAAPTREAVARPGEFCTPAACRPRSASPLTGAAFAATVLAIGWQARRRDSAAA